MSHLEVAQKCTHSTCRRTTKNASLLCWQHEHSSSVTLPPENLKTSLKTVSGDSEERDLSKKWHHKPREEQLEATKNVMDEFRSGADRCQVRAAPGMGKTTIHQMVITEIDQEIQQERGKSGIYVVFAPRIKLAKQLRGEYERDGFLDITDEDGDVIPGTTFSVHDDSDDMKRSGNTLQDEKENEEAIRKFLTNPDMEDHPRILFAVQSPDSVDKVARIQRSLGIQFDCAVMDEGHNLTGNLAGSKKDDEDGKRFRPTRLYFNEDTKGIDTARRFFTTATPKTSKSSTDSRFDRSSETDTKQKYLKMLDEVDKGKSPSVAIPAYSTNEQTFGRVVASWSYSYAVDKGMLVRPEISTSNAVLKVGDLGNTPISRKTEVMYDGTVVTKTMSKKGHRGDLTVGTYQNLAATLEALSDDESGSQQGRRNVLAFANSVAEATASTDRAHWRSVAMSMARDARGGQEPMTQHEAVSVLSNPGSSSEQERKAARLVLLAEHAQLASSSSKHSQQEKEFAENFFDDKRPGDAGGFTIDDINGWSPCARIVSNYDMFSEGINISSVDTVVMGRPRKSSDEDMCQAVGRSSRKWLSRDSEGNVEEDFKPRARVIIPTSEMVDPRGRRRATLVSDTVQSMRSMSRVWRDSGDGPWKGNDPEAPDPYLTVKGDSRYGYGEQVGLSDYATRHVTELAGEQRLMTAERAAAITDTYQRVYSAAQKDYNDDRSNQEEWVTLSPSEQFRHVQQAASARAGQGSKSVMYDDFLAAGLTSETIEVAQAYRQDYGSRVRRDDWRMEDEQREVEQLGDEIVRNAGDSAPLARKARSRFSRILRQR